jgi:hypothetical protein
VSNGLYSESTAAFAALGSGNKRTKKMAALRMRVPRREIIDRIAIWLKRRFDGAPLFEQRFCVADMVARNNQTPQLL